MDRSVSLDQPSRLLPDVSVIIVNWNLKEMLRECLDSVLKSTNDLNLEIIVIDNASTDGSVEMLRDNYPGVILIENESNVGFARANNQALNIGRGRYFLLLNNDAVLLDHALKQMIEFMDAQPRAGLCGPRIENTDGSMQIRTKGRFPSVATALGHFFVPSAWQRHLGRPLGFYDVSDDLRARSIDWLSGCALMARREAVDDVGLFDSSVFMYCEDIDWCRRMSTAGWGVYYLPEARVKHYLGQSMKKQTGKPVAAHKDGLITYYSKYHSRPATAAFRLVLWTGYGFYATGWLLGALVGRKDGLDKLKRMLPRSRFGSDS